MPREDEACDLNNYIPSNEYAPGNAVCTDELPENTTCNVCGDSEFDNGEICDVSSSDGASCADPEYTCVDCACEDTTPYDEYICMVVDGNSVWQMLDTE